MNKRKHVSQAMILSVLLLISVIGFSFGQTITGKIDGVVTDNEGVPLPGVTVTATSPAAMGTPTSITSDKGTFRFTNLPPGMYKLVFTLDGFQTVVYGILPSCPSGDKNCLFFHVGSRYNFMAAIIDIIFGHGHNNSIYQVTAAKYAQGAA